MIVLIDFMMQHFLQGVVTETDIETTIADS